MSSSEIPPFLPRFPLPGAGYRLLCHAKRARALGRRSSRRKIPRRRHDHAENRTGIPRTRTIYSSNGPERWKFSRLLISPGTGARVHVIWKERGAGRAEGGAENGGSAQRKKRGTGENKMEGKIQKCNFIIRHRQPPLALLRSSVRPYVSGHPRSQLLMRERTMTDRRQNVGRFRTRKKNRFFIYGARGSSGNGKLRTRGRLCSQMGCEADT